MEYYIVLLVFYAITLIFLRLVFAEIEGRQARKMSNVRYFLRYHSKFVYRNQFSIIFVAFLCYMIVSVEKAFSTMWFLQLLGFIAVGVISDALSQIVYYYYIMADGSLRTRHQRAVRAIVGRTLSARVRISR